MTEAYYYDEFPSRVTSLASPGFIYTCVCVCVIVPQNLILCIISGQDVFEGACDCAREWNGLLWEDSKKMHMVVKTEVHTYVRDFLRRQK